MVGCFLEYSIVGSFLYSLTVRETGEREESETVDLETEGYDSTEVPNDVLLTETMGSDFSVWFIFIEKILRVVVPVVVILGVVIWVVIRIVKRKK